MLCAFCRRTKPKADPFSGPELSRGSRVVGVQLLMLDAKGNTVDLAEEVR
jgi:hypothetical protein